MLLAEAVVVGSTMSLSLLLAAMIFTPAGGEGSPGYRFLFYGTVLLAVAAVIVVFAAVHVSRRIGGPVYKIRQALAALRSGEDPGRITIRKEDDLHEIVEALNGALEQLRKREGDMLEGAPPVSAEVLHIVHSTLHPSADAEGGGRPNQESHTE